jgi:acyl-CoA dehydrogenase
MNDTARMLQDLAERLFGDGCTPAAFRAAEDGGWDAALGSSVAAAGLAQAGVPEALGGAGATWAEALGIAEAAGRHALPAPVVETLVANRLLAHAGLPPAPGAASVATAGPATLALRRNSKGGSVGGTLARVPWGRGVEHVVVLARTQDNEGTVALASTAEARVVHGRSVAGEPRDDLVFDEVEIDASRTAIAADDAARAWLEAGALARCAQMVGAMEWILARTLAYSRDRLQFGKPIAGFQAVQHLLARMAGETCAARVAFDAARACADDAGTRQLSTSVAHAKSVAGVAAGQVAAWAHQVHGAMGYSQEYPLHLRTRRLWCWREEFGGERDWQIRIGREVCSAGGAALWPELTGP